MAGRLSDWEINSPEVAARTIGEPSGGAAQSLIQIAISLALYFLSEIPHEPKYLGQYVAMFEWAHNLKRVTNDFLRTLMIPSFTYSPI